MSDSMANVPRGGPELERRIREEVVPRMQARIARDVALVKQARNALPAGAVLSAGLAVRYARAYRGLPARTAPGVYLGPDDEEKKPALQLLRPLGREARRFLIAFAPPAAPDGAPLPVSNYELVVTAPDVRCRLEGLVLNPEPPRFVAQLGREAALLIVPPDDPRLRPLAQARPGEWRVELTAWGANDSELASTVVDFLVTEEPPPPDRYWRQRAHLEEEQGRPLEALSLLERVAHPLRRDLDMLELLQRQVAALRIELDGLDEQHGARRAAVKSLLGCLEPLLSVYEGRVASYSPKEG